MRFYSFFVIAVMLFSGAPQVLAHDSIATMGIDASEGYWGGQAHVIRDWILNWVLDR